jgi:hypothetical protein
MAWLLLSRWNGNGSTRPARWYSRFSAAACPKAVKSE